MAKRKSASRSTWDIIRSNVFTYFNLVFAVIAVILFMVGSYRDLTFLPIIILNTLTGIVQELRAKRTLDKLTLVTAPKARVVKGDEVVPTMIEDLQVGDVVIFRAGDQIPADARVIAGAVAMNEALLTGEADEVQKTERQELMSGSFVVSGECRARLVKVGDESYAAKLAQEAKAMKTGEQSEMLRSLNQIVKWAGVAIIPIGALLFLQQFWQGVDVQTATRAAVAAVIGMIPEGLFLLATATLVLSVMRLARSQVLVHEMKCIETLARVDTLCVDKTGTITDDQMAVEMVEELVPGARERLVSVVHAEKADNVTMEAMKQWAKRREGEKQWGEAKEVMSFSSQYKYSGARFKAGTYVLGAPELLLGERFKEYQVRIEAAAEKGYRVVAFGKTLDELGGAPQGGFKLEALVLLMNRVRKTAPATFRYFQEQGVEVKVISGDNALTVAEVARQAGIEGELVDMSTVKSKKQLAEVATRCTIFGRVRPEQKRELVQALQAAGRTVAMTGDGVNDVLALKDADCSVAMASGAQAAMQVAQLVLLDSDFARMPQIVREGRRVVNNLERAGSLFLVKNVFSLVTAALAIVFGLRYPLTPSQVSLVTMFTIGVPSFFLAQAPGEGLIKGRFITNVLKRAVPAAVIDILLVMILVVEGQIWNWSPQLVSNLSTIAMGVVGMGYLYAMSMPMNAYKRAIWWACLIGLVGSILLMGEVWGIVW